MAVGEEIHGIGSALELVVASFGQTERDPLAPTVPIRPELGDLEIIETYMPGAKNLNRAAQLYAQTDERATSWESRYFAAGVLSVAVEALARGIDLRRTPEPDEQL